MARKQPVPPSQRAHMEGKLAEVERHRSQPVSEADVERILTGLRSEVEATRATAVREICPCRMPWEVFDRLRQAAKRLRQDPSPLVRANALHVEEDAREVASLEALAERLQEWEEREEEVVPRPDRRGRGRRRR